jgi:hypothetical protein
MAPRPITDSDDGRTIVFPFEEVEVGPHCTEMTTDSQRNLRAFGAHCTVRRERGKSPEPRTRAITHQAGTDPLAGRTRAAELERIKA